MGLIIDTVNQIVGLPLDKIKKAKGLITHFLQSKTVTVKQVQCLSGLLNFFTRAIPAGVTFNRSLYDLLSNRPGNKNHHVNINATVKGDLKVWLEFFDHNPPYLKFQDIDPITSEDIGMYTDAAGGKNLGLGCVWNDRWIALAWPQGFILVPGVNPPISYLELYGIAIAVGMWGQELKDRRFVIHSDNTGAVEMINTGSSRNTACNHLLKQICKMSLKYNFKVEARYVEGEKNTRADALSRLQIQEFFSDFRTYSQVSSRSGSTISVASLEKVKETLITRGLSASTLKQYRNFYRDFIFFFE